MWGGKKSHFYFTANCHVSLSPVCLSLSHSVSSLSGSLAVRALVTKALNSDLPFLLASKIFMRTIRSSDKESAEGRATERAGCASRMSARLSVRPSVRPATLHTQDHRPPSPRVRGAAAPLASVPAVTAVAPCQPTASHPAPRPSSQQASLCPRPWAAGRGGSVGHSTHSRGQADCGTAVHESKVSLSAAQPTRSAGATDLPPLPTVFNGTNRQFLQLEQT